MNKILLRVAIIAGVFTAMTGKLIAQEKINVVSTAVPFLRISPDARGGAMGDASIAISADANATFVNAAKIPFGKTLAQVGVTYTPWLKDVTQDVFLATVGGYYQIDENQALHGGLRYFNLGNIQFTDDQGNDLGGQAPREFSLEGGYSRKLSNQFSVGATFRYINSKLFSGQDPRNADRTYKPGNAISADISAFYNGLNENEEGLTAGLSLSNIGSKISYSNDPDSKSFLPANIGVGAAYTTNFDEDSRLTFLADANHLLVPKYPEDGNYADYFAKGVLEGMASSFGNGAYSLSAGAEFSYVKQFFARAGYYYETKQAGARNYFTAGLGVKYNVFGLNFSYLAPQGNSLNRNPLSNTLRFSLLFDLNALQ